MSVGLKYEQCKGGRFKKDNFFCVATFDGYWWDDNLKRWIESYSRDSSRSRFYGVKSVRAFRRRLREWSRYLPSGVKFILASRYFKHDIYGKTQ